MKKKSINLFMFIIVGIISSIILTISLKDKFNTSLEAKAYCDADYVPCAEISDPGQYIQQYINANLSGSKYRNVRYSTTYNLTIPTKNHSQSYNNSLYTLARIISGESDFPAISGTCSLIAISSLLEFIRETAILNGVNGFDNIPTNYLTIFDRVYRIATEVYNCDYTVGGNSFSLIDNIYHDTLAFYNVNLTVNQEVKYLRLYNYVVDNSILYRVPCIMSLHSWGPFNSHSTVSNGTRDYKINYQKRILGFIWTNKEERRILASYQNGHYNAYDSSYSNYMQYIDAEINYQGNDNNYGFTWIHEILWLIGYWD